MPPYLWTAIAALLSAAMGAAIAHAVGRAYRASLRHPTTIRVGLPRGSSSPVDTQSSLSPVLARSVPQVGVGADQNEVNVRVMTETGQPVRLTVQRLWSDGSTQDLLRTTLPGSSTAREAPAGDRGPHATAARFLGRVRGTIDASMSALGRLRLGRSLNLGSAEIGLAVAAAVLYIVTRLWAIDSFPIFFYSDEVNNVLFGEQVYQQGLLGVDNSWPAVYLPWEENRWSPVLGVYLHGLAAALLGKSIFVARALNALISLGGTLAAAWILNESFKARFWWAAILFAIGVPAWFLYSRTAFEVVLGASLYAAFLLVYARYRFRSPRFLPLAAAIGAAAFYAYSNMQPMMVALSVCLFISDFRYHLSHRATWLRTLPVLVLLAIPFFEFCILHPEAPQETLHALDSYWLQDLPLTAKLVQYARTFLHGLSPLYWFAPEYGTGILPVQFIPGAGHLGYVMLPFVALGLYVSARNLRSPLHRLVLLSALVVPTGSAIDTIEITRVLPMVIPALLLAVLGLEQLGTWLKAIPPHVQTAAVAIVLSVLGLTRLVDALVHGPTWPTDYGLQGAQFGTKVLFEDVIPQMLAEDPEATLVMTTTWGNNVHIYPRFFLPQSEQERVVFSNIRDYLRTIRPLEPGTIIVMTPDEYADAVASPMLGKPEVVKTVSRPNGEPGFYFARIAYVADAEHVLQEQDALRVQLIESEVDVLGIPTTVRHSKLGDGEISRLFDGSAATLVRTDGVNPFQIEIPFAEPRQLDGVHVTVGSFADFTVSLTLTLPGVDEPVVVSERFHDLGPDPTVSLSLPSPDTMVSLLRLEVSDNTQGPSGMIHVREITLY